MEPILITRDQLDELIESATLHATSILLKHFQSVLIPKEEKICITKAYRIKETAKLLLMSESTVRRNYNCINKERIMKKGKCLLKRNRNGFFLGASVQAEYNRLYGK